MDLVAAGPDIAQVDVLATLALAALRSVGLLLARTGFRLVKESSQALLDMEDPEVLRKVLANLEG